MDRSEWESYFVQEASFEYLQNEGERTLLEAMDALEVALSHPLVSAVIKSNK